MLKKRIITAAILIPITLLVLFYLPPVSFLMLTGFITLGAAWEWTNLMEVKDLSKRFIYLVLMVFIFILAMTHIPLSFIFLSTFIWWLLATLLILFYPRFTHFWHKSTFWRGLMGIFVLVPCWVAINYIRNQEAGIYILLFLFVIIWGADSAAYFVGKKWGKHKLAPLVSPGKSWEGFIGAIICSALITLLTVWISHLPSHLWPYVILLSLVTVLFSIIGDLFESMLKRQAGLKDSGNLLPGHGGLLDRIDSLTAAAPIFAFGAGLLGNYIN